MFLDQEISKILKEFGGRIRHLETMERAAAGGGGAPLDASYVTTAAEAGLSAEKVLGTDVIMRGAAAAKPAASIAGRIYIETDGSFIVHRDTGAGWNEIARGEAGTRLAQLAEKAHGSLTGVTAGQHHDEFTPAQHDVRDHTVVAGPTAIKWAVLLG